MIIKFIFLSLVFFNADLNSEVLTFDISEKEIRISDKKNTPDFIVYGFSNFKDSIVLKIKGPTQKVILQKKKKIFNMWTWSKTGEFSYPGLSHYYSNNVSDEIDFEIKKDLVDNIKLIGKDDDNLKKELIEKKRSIDLFLIKNDSFKKINKEIPSFFKVPVFLPKNSPEGDYEVSMSIVNKTNAYETNKQKIIIKKPGVSSFVYKMAHNFSFIYAVFSVIIAISFGLLAGVLFRKS
ncbi:MAG: hypothetical protein CMN01_04620 [Rickettsiales bacterium]|nr:hypothetical protein [Rickettsiales bacterium]|tara:strand:- start:13092 stop:13799 length:708 start_codon:yes stop_codon:yes gene_type:complete